MHPNHVLILEAEIDPGSGQDGEEGHPVILFYLPSELGEGGPS